STIVPPGLSRPSVSAASIIARAGRSLIEPEGFALSSLRNRRQGPRSIRVTSTRGVSPIRSRTEVMIFVYHPWAKQRNRPPDEPSLTLLLPLREVVWVILALFDPILNRGLRLLLSLWACGQRPSRCPHVHSDTERCRASFRWIIAAPPERQRVAVGR